MATEVILILIGAGLSIIGKMIAASLQRVVGSMYQVRDEVTKLTCTVESVVAKLKTIEDNYVSKSEFIREQTAMKELHDAHRTLYNEHNRCLHCRQDDGK